MDKKKKTIIIGVIVAVLVIGLIIILAVCCHSDESKLTSNMEKLGKNFYEDYYYPSQKKSQKNVTKYMAKFSKNGISINLDNLVKISSLDSELLTTVKDLAKDNKCDFSKTKISIIPTKPYAKTDYKLSVDLDCKKIDK